MSSNVYYFMQVKKSCGYRFRFALLTGCVMLTLCPAVWPAHAAVSSANIPLDSPFYAYLDKLSGSGLIRTDSKGIRPYTRSEGARLLAEARQRAAGSDIAASAFIEQVLREAERHVARETALRDEAAQAPSMDWQPLQAARLRYVYLDGAPRSYERQVHDPGGDGVFGIGGGLRPSNAYPSPVNQHGTEGTPLLENNEGNRYRRGNNGELRWSSEVYAGRVATAAVEPLLSLQEESSYAALRLNKGYLKLGGGSLELEVGRDAAWFGPGYRGEITLTNNAKNFDLVKLSSPEPLDLGSWGQMKYCLIGSRFDRTTVDAQERQPWLFAMKLAYKPAVDWEIGFNLGRQVGGPGVDNSFGSTIRGFLGGTNSDNSNSMAGFDLRYRAPWLRNTEFYGEFSGEDAASFWPIVESYLAGVHIPNLTVDGRNELRFEYFQGNQILYTNSTFPGGYLYHDMPIGHSQGGATQELYFRYAHWLSARTTLAAEYFNTRRGVVGKMPGQATERKDALRGSVTLPFDAVDLTARYGWEYSDNLNLVPGETRTNQLLQLEVSYRY